jgi:hypothetical protein
LFPLWRSSLPPGKNGQRLMWMGYRKAGLCAYTNTSARPARREDA